MKLIRFGDTSQYYQRVKCFLLENEAVNCLPLAICFSLRDGDGDQSFYLALVEDSGTVLAAAIHIRDRKLLLAKSRNLLAVELIAQDLAINHDSISGITAPKAEAETFVAVWRKLVKKSIKLEVAMQVQQLEKLKAINYAAGKLRLATATATEIELLTGWSQAFAKEALGENESEANSRGWVMRNLEQGSLYVWENQNSLVSMAACGGVTPNGIRVKSVYTPSKYRGNGYGTSCVATISKRLRDYYQYCFLFTDTANPVSNKIYRKIGYIPIGDIRDYGFY